MPRLREQLPAEDDDREEFLKLIEQRLVARNRPAIHGTPEEHGWRESGNSPGGKFVRSAAYKAWMHRFPSGSPAMSQHVTADPVEVGSLRALLAADEGMRALITSADASAGTLVRPNFLGLIEPGLVRPLTVVQLLTILPVQGDAIEYVKETSRISNAAPTPEAYNLITGGVGIKPEGGLAFEVVTDVVRTIAEWVPATKRIISDAPQLQQYIDQYLRDDIAIEIEDQVIGGNGSGENFLGILNQGISTAGPPTGTQTMLDPIRTAKRLILSEARTRATAVVLNPEDDEAIDLLKDDIGRYLSTGPFGNGAGVPTIWGLPVVECEAMIPGTALVGDFRKAVLFDREATAISVGTVGDDFIRNIVRVLGEARAGFGVSRPKAFVAVDLA